MNKKLVGSLILSLVALAAIGYSYKGANDSKQGVYTIGVPTDREEFYESTYASYLSSNGYQGNMSKGEVVVDINNYTAADGTRVTTDQEGVITPEEGKVTWQFDVKTPGFYNLEVGFLPVEGKNSTIERKMYLDDQVCFKGMEQLSFERTWANETAEIEVRNDNEIRPNTVELINPKQTFVEDAQRRGTEPYKFYLSQGTHTLTFEAIKEPVKITNLVFKADEPILSYEETINKLQGTYPLYEGNLLVGQAERNEGITKNVLKSSRAILINTNYSSPRIEPSHPSNLVFNTIGGDSWKTPGDGITWEVEVPESGLYQVSFTARQSSNRGGVSYRKLLVNGKVPFKEANSIGFPYSTGFKNYVIGNDDGAYLIPLEKGINTITLETVLGQFDRATTEVQESLFVLNETYRKIIQLTGTVPDSYIDYEIEKKLPEVKDIFTQESERLGNILEEVISITGEKGEDSVIIDKLVIQLGRLAKNPELVVKELSQLKNNISSLGLWNMEVASMPLEVDSITLGTEQKELIQTEAGFVENFAYESQRFLSTFIDDNTQMSGKVDKKQESIKVWIGTGRDQAQVMMNLIEERFTPLTGINVQLELIPESVIIPATLAGRGPDIVTGITEQQAMNFAVRNALVDLNEFDGFSEMYTQYEPSAFEGITFQEGIFGMPEQQSFMMLFYRQDILDELGLEVPTTWEEVKAIIPVLQMHNYDFYMPAGTADPNGTMYASLVFQGGNDMYLGEGNDYGIETGLYEEGAMRAFQDYTQFFTSYHLPVVADFANRFRTGEVPMGIAPYTVYSQLQVSAPEIRGLWSFSPVPGKVKEDGTVDNTLVSSTTQCIMLEQGKNRDAAWEFMKWWTSEEVQLEYGTTIEGIMGPAARYPSANVDVVEQLPWSVKDAGALKEQFRATKGLPEVPGGYMTSRMVSYAFKNVVTDGQNPREALYLNAKEINDELTKKRKEFNLSTVESE
ncbi:extracellular solute-binding protein [Niameybacter massiliensis]|uniref:extracellular solute-binding protein n=1 Tax=Niameybacter massiliensis TaxID=1658108 RepID=UPI0006B69431|nr:extracellular solute-binding protein [Niameybacter massiliensis]